MPGIALIIDTSLAATDMEKAALTIQTIYHSKEMHKTFSISLSHSHTNLLQLIFLNNNKSSGKLVTRSFQNSKFLGTTIYKSL